MGDLDRQPVEALYFLVLLVLVSIGATLLSTASKKCPAAVSATVTTGTQMVLGFMVDVFCTLDVNLDDVKPQCNQKRDGIRVSSQRWRRS